MSNLTASKVVNICYFEGVGKGEERNKAMKGVILLICQCLNMNNFLEKGKMFSQFKSTIKYT